MSTTRLLGCIQVLALAGGLSSVATADAADLNARDFVSAPPGTTLGVFYMPMTRANDYHGTANRSGGAALSVNAVAWRQLVFTDPCGTLCTPQFIVPFANIDARLPGTTGHRSETGFGDPQVGTTLYLINNPDTRTYSGLLSLITLPVGEYHSQNPDVSPGANRWGATFVYNLTQGIGQGQARGTNLNIPLLPGGGNDAYQYAMDTLVLPALTRFEPELIIVACGYDANAVDPLARMLLHSEAFRTMTTKVRQAAEQLCSGRLVLVHEGGYAEAYVPFCGLATLEALSGVHTDVQDPLLAFIDLQQPPAPMQALQRQLLDAQRQAFEHQGGCV